MNEPIPFKRLPRGMVNHCVPPNILCLLTGTQYAKQDKAGLITLVHTDGSTTCRAADFDICAPSLDYLKIVTYVQKGVRP